MLVQLQQFMFDNYPGLQPRQTYSDQPFWGWFVRTAILCHRNTFSHWKLSAKRQSGVNSCAHAPTTCVCAKEGWKVHWRVCVMIFAVKRITDRQTNAEEMQLRQSNHRCRWVNVWVYVLQLQMLRIWLQAIFTNTTAQQSIVYTLPYHTIPYHKDGFLYVPHARKIQKSLVVLTAAADDCCSIPSFTHNYCSFPTVCQVREHRTLGRSLDHRSFHRSVVWYVCECTKKRMLKVLSFLGNSRSSIYRNFAPKCLHRSPPANPATHLVPRRKVKNVRRAVSSSKTPQPH